MPMKRPSLKERQWQVREEAIIESAHELMSKRGYADTTMDELAAHTGISKATLYQHFSSKEDVAINVIVLQMRLGEALLAAIDPTMPAIQGIEQWLRGGLSKRIGKPTYGMNLLPLSILHHQRYQEQEQRIYALACSLIERAKAEGDIPGTIATSVAARLMMRLFRGDYDDLVQTGQLSAADVIDSLVTILLHGLRGA